MHVDWYAAITAVAGALRCIHTYSDEVARVARGWRGRVKLHVHS